MKQQTTDQSKCRMCGADVDEVSLNSDSMSVGCLDEWFCSCKCANLAVTSREIPAAAEIRETIREMLTVWESLTPTQIADALASASAAADKAEAAFLASPTTDADHHGPGASASARALAYEALGIETAPADHCATCGHYQEWHSCEAGDFARPAKAADEACELYTTERPSDLIDDGYGLRARGGLVYFG